MKAPTKYIALETAACYNFGTLAKKVKNEIRRRWPDLSDQEEMELTYKNLEKFILNEQSFKFVHKNNHLGGLRWFVLCPKCSRKSLKLYLPKPESKREQKYLCKECHKLKNASALMGATKKYHKVVKPLKKLEKIKKSLLSKGMTPEKAIPLLDAYDRIEKELESAPEYRLWKFQKRHKNS